MEMLSTFLQALHYIIPFVVVLSVVVFVHEFGHYWVARRCGVKVESFSLGFGKEIYGWNDRHGTRWKISCLPLGGYVKMFGDADPSSARPDESVKDMNEAEKKVAFYYQNVAKRFAIVAAGPVTNYLFAIAVMTVLFVLSGQPFTAPIVDKVLENSAAARAGFMENDRVVRIDGKEIAQFEDIKRIVAFNTGTPLEVELVRDGQNVQLSVTPEVKLMKDRLGSEHRLGSIGIASRKVEFRQHTPGSALVQAGGEAWRMSGETLRAVGQMIMGTRDAEEIGGPLRIAEMSGKMAQEGESSLIWFMAIISLNLGLVNLFPIPLLDGGNLVFYAIEFLRRRPLSERTQEIGTQIGGVLVLLLMLFATWNDLVHLRVISYLRDAVSHLLGLFS